MNSFLELLTLVDGSAGVVGGVAGDGLALPHSHCRHTELSRSGRSHVVLEVIIVGGLLLVIFTLSIAVTIPSSLENAADLLQVISKYYIFSWRTQTLEMITCVWPYKMRTVTTVQCYIWELSCLKLETFS